MSDREHPKAGQAPLAVEMGTFGGIVEISSCAQAICTFESEKSQSLDQVQGGTWMQYPWWHAHMVMTLCWRVEVYRKTVIERYLVTYKSLSTMC